MSFYTTLAVGILLALAAIFGYISGIRSLQASRRTANYLVRQEYIIRARRSFVITSFFVIAGISIFVVGQLFQQRPFSLPPLNFPVTPATSTETSSPTGVTPTTDNAIHQESSPTFFVVTASPVIVPTSSPSPQPSIPIGIEASFQGLVTPRPDVEIGKIRFSTEVKNFQPIAPATKFNNPVKHLYAIFSYKGLDIGVQWTALWYLNGQLKHFQTKPWSDANAGLYITDWEQPAQDWLPGNYEVQIFIGKEWKVSGLFTLEGTPPTITPIASVTPTTIPSKTPTTTQTPSSTATTTPSRIPSQTPSRTAIFTPSNTPTKTPLPTATTISSHTPTKSPVPTSTIALSRTPTQIPSLTAAIAPSRTPVITLAPTATIAPTRTPTKTPLPTATVTPMNTATRTPTKTSRPSSTPLPTLTQTPASVTINVYFTEKSRLEKGTSPFERAVPRIIPSSSNPISATVDEFFRGPSAAEQSGGLIAIWNGFTGYRRIEFANGILHIYLSGKCQSNGSAYNIAQPLIKNTKQFPGITYVKIYDEYDSTRDSFGKNDSTPICLDPGFTPSPTITTTPKITPTATPSRTPTQTPSLTPTVTPTRRPTQTPSLTPTATPTRTPTQTPSLTPTVTPTRRPTQTPSLTPTVTPTRRPTQTPTMTPTVTPSRTPSPKPSLTPRATPSRTPSRTPSLTSTVTPTRRPTQTSSLTPTVTPTRRPPQTPSLTPTVTPTRRPTQTPTSTPGLKCNRATFIDDVTIPDNTVLYESENFSKTWRIQNTGTCIWTSSYKIYFVKGDKLGANDSVSLPSIVNPGQTVDISINLTAPNKPGRYQGYWQFTDGLGNNFGVGPSADKLLWVKIDIVTRPEATATLSIQPTDTPTPAIIASPEMSPTEFMGYDFVKNACSAQWTNNDGELPCPGQEGNSQGYVLTVNQSKLEDGTIISSPSLLTFPKNINDGYIQAIYPEYMVQAGDRFHAKVSCEGDNLSCSVLFRFSYRDITGTINDLWAVGEFYDGKYSDIDIDLNKLAGQNVRFIMTVISLGANSDNHALWIAPNIVRFPMPTPTIVDTSTPTPTLTPTYTPIITITPSSTPGLVQTPEDEHPSIIQRMKEFIINLFRQLFGN